jgi:hypothetical protein
MVGVECEEDLRDVDLVELEINTLEQPVAFLGEMMPKLAELKLSGSTISSLRDLGTHFDCLRVLWVSRCGLSHLDGVQYLSGLEELYASFNDVSDLWPLTELPQLSTLDLEGNGVCSLGAVASLGACEQLTELSLSGNPIASVPLYRRAVLGRLPFLEVLDDRDVVEGEREALDDAVDAAVVVAARAMERLAMGGGDELSEQDEKALEAARQYAEVLGDVPEEEEEEEASLLNVPDADLEVQLGGRGRESPRMDVGVEEETIAVMEAVRSGSHRCEPLFEHLSRPASASVRPRTGDALWERMMRLERQQFALSPSGSLRRPSESAHELSPQRRRDIPRPASARPRAVLSAGGGNRSAVSRPSSSFAGSERTDEDVAEELIRRLHPPREPISLTGRVEHTSDELAFWRDCSKADPPGSSVAVVSSRVKDTQMVGGAASALLRLRKGNSRHDVRSLELSLQRLRERSGSSKAVPSAVELDDGTVVTMLRQRPKDVPELRSKAAFRSFFTGTSRSRMTRLLLEAFDLGRDVESLSEESRARLERRLELVADVLS